MSPIFFRFARFSKFDQMRNGEKTIFINKVNFLLSYNPPILPHLQFLSSSFYNVELLITQASLQICKKKEHEKSSSTMMINTHFSKMSYLFPIFFDFCSFFEIRSHEKRGEKTIFINKVNFFFEL
jgi:hypothetical protein